IGTLPPASHVHLRVPGNKPCMNSPNFRGLARAVPARPPSHAARATSPPIRRPDLTEQHTVEQAVASKPSGSGGGAVQGGGESSGVDDGGRSVRGLGESREGEGCDYRPSLRTSYLSRQEPTPPRQIHPDPPSGGVQYLDPVQMGSYDPVGDAMRLWGPPPDDEMVFDFELAERYFEKREAIPLLYHAYQATLETLEQSFVMRPTGAAPSSQPTSPPLLQPAELFDMSLPISKMARMAMSTNDATRAALRSHIVTPTRQQELLGHTSATVTSTLLNGVQHHINKAIRRLGLKDVFAFDIAGDVEGGLRVVWLLEQGTGEEWRAMGRFLRMAFIYRLTPAKSTRPLRVSADSLSAAATLHQLPITLAIYKIIGQQLSDNWTSLALQQDDDGNYRIGNESFGDESFRVVPLGELAGGHPYANSYKRTDPVILSSRDSLYPSFSAYLLRRLLNSWPSKLESGGREVLSFLTDRDDLRCRRLQRTEGITEDQGIAVDYRYYHGDDLNAADAGEYRQVIVSGFRPDETIAAHLTVEGGSIQLWTTEASVRGKPLLLALRFPESTGAVRRLLRPFGLERDVIDRGTVRR
ncbi:unnamed protein product, partial [Vitrella brassicaformis CCMP3155]